jgi:nitrite reductase (NADH) large subunit
MAQPGAARYVILGSGAAGIGAVEGIRSLDPDGEILLISDEPEGYYSRPGLAYYLTGELVEKQLFPFNGKDFQRLKVQRLTGRVVSLYLKEQQVLLESGVRIVYDQLLIATGSMAAQTKFPGIQAQGVVKLDNIADARSILARARKARSAVVVGGGITALEIVEGLIARRVKVHYLLRGDRYWSNVLDEVESHIVEHRLKEEGVQIHFNAELEEAIEKKGILTGVCTKDGKLIDCQLLAVAIGVLPRKELVLGSDLKMDRSILVDEFMQTSQSGVFAAGDVSQVYDPLSGRHVLDTLWEPAREQGTTAGKNMAAQVQGKPFSTYTKHVAFNVTRLAGLTTTIIGTVGSGRDADLLGIARGDSEVWRQMPDAIAAQSGFDVNHLRLMIGEKTILGAIVMGDQTVSRPVHHLIRDQVDITPICDQLLKPGVKLGEVIAEFWAGRK